MRYQTFAAIVIGSKNILMKIYEISPKNGIRLIDQLGHEYELGKEAYITRKITFSQIDEICEVLKDFKQHMKEYAVSDYKCYATSAVRNASNQISMVNHVKIRTGIDILILSNSELRFLTYKGVYLSPLNIDEVIQKNTALLDIGSGSVQVSLFDKGVLYSTQNMNIGTARVRETLEAVEHNALDYVSVMEEYIQYELEQLKNAYMKDKQIKNIVIMGDEVKHLNRIVPELNLGNTMNQEQLDHLYKKVRKASYKDLASKYGLSIEEARMTLPSVLIYKMFLDNAKAETIYICDTNLCDGSAVEYAAESGKIKLAHDYYQDIIASARYLGKRYRYNKNHAECVRELALMIFDKTSRYHGLSKRDRLLLEIAAIVHDIGKFVNLNEPGMNGYQLIMSTEIIGISHKEREDVARVIRYNTDELPAQGAIDYSFDREDYLKIAKLSAILRLANALDRGHKQKYQDLTMVRKGKELIITVSSDQDITLEISLFSRKATYFGEIMGIVPVLRQKRTF